MRSKLGSKFFRSRGEFKVRSPRFAIQLLENFKVWNSKAGISQFWNSKFEVHKSSATHENNNCNSSYGLSGKADWGQSLPAQSFAAQILEFEFWNSIVGIIKFWNWTFQLFTVWSWATESWHWQATNSTSSSGCE